MFWSSFLQEYDALDRVVGEVDPKKDDKQDPTDENEDYGKGKQQQARNKPVGLDDFDLEVALPGFLLEIIFLGHLDLGKEPTTIITFITYIETLIPRIDSIILLVPVVSTTVWAKRDESGHRVEQSYCIL